MISLPANPRILVICVARFGDTLLLTPILRALKAACPGAHLTVVAHPQRQEVLHHNPHIDELVAFTKRTASWRGRFGQPRYDVALVYGKDRALAQYARRTSQQLIAFEFAEYAGIRLDASITPPTEPTHAVHERALLLAPLAIPLTSLRLEYQLTPAERSWAQDWLVKNGLDNTPFRFAFQLQSFPTKPYRNWPVESFMALAHRLQAAKPGARGLLLGGPESTEAVAALARRAPELFIPLAGRLTLRQTAALMQQLQLYVGVDTGPSHLAGALQVPMAVLYHARHPGRCLCPLEHPHLAIVDHPRCGAADASEQDDMADIGVEQVWQSLEPLLFPQEQP